MLERASILRNWRKIASRVVDAVKEVCPEACVYIAGSVARGEWIAASDVDIIVVLPHSPSMREAAQIIEHVWRRLELPAAHPLEIHVVGPKDLERYVRKGVAVQLA
jgi:predicted nucleotidyltransferase